MSQLHNPNELRSAYGRLMSYERVYKYNNKLQYIIIIMHLPLASPWGGTPGKYKIIWGLIGDFE